MAKTKRKHLAALEAIKDIVPVTEKEHKTHYFQAERRLSSKPAPKEVSPVVEVRQQRVIIWIPPPTSNPKRRAPQSLTNTNGVAEAVTNDEATTVSRKRKHAIEEAKEADSPATDPAEVNRSYSKVILKLGNWRREKVIDEAGPSMEAAQVITTEAGPLLATQVNITEQSTHKPSTKIELYMSPKKRTRSQRVTSKIPPSLPAPLGCEAGSEAVPADNFCDPPVGINGSSKRETDGVPEDCNRERIAETPTILNKKWPPVIQKRRASSLKGLLAADPGPQSPIDKVEEMTMIRKIEAVPSMETAQPITTEKSPHEPTSKIGLYMSSKRRTRPQRVVFNIPPLPAPEVMRCAAESEAVQANACASPVGMTFHCKRETNGVLEDCTRDTLADTPTTLSKKSPPATQKRRASSLKGLLAADPAPQSPFDKIGGMPMNRKAEAATGTDKQISMNEQQKVSVSLNRPTLCNRVNRPEVVTAKLKESGGLNEWLIERGLGVFVGLFEERKIDEAALVQLTMGSLKEMGVHAVGPRRKLISAIEGLL